jgi:D-lactate dehydrogenase
MKVTVFSTKNFEISSLERANNNKHELRFISKSLSHETVHLADNSEAICIFPNDDASSSVLEELKRMNISYVANRAAGYDHIDISKANELNIRVANVPAYSPHSVAEHAAALILSLNRKIIVADHKVKDYNFSLDGLIGFDLNGKTAGIIGLGKIGSVLAKILNGFGCKILAYDLYQDEELASKYNITYCDLDELCRKSDIISIHAPLTPSTKYIINKRSIDLMKQDVMIINTSRGALLKTEDAIEGLKSGKIGYLGLDVYEKEKGMFFYDHSHETMQDDLFARLLSFRNVIVTGHQAFLTENALKNIADTTIENLDKWEKGEKVENELTSVQVLVNQNNHS